ncbi:DUF1156 domain-containing protein [Halogeometricum sp. S1BR25-6]|uniref:DUF1156 domain-containing protein n=1 Tax=Halogeometricum salsisoli TaxID=2950536 RepID=A0ABU2GL71_9EURY|nr:DUF1156 domain-containing protein [Halogeometricum sp. S1BR25-6]MDS0300939.1 DUF1156 domain-containing protein [Halogeometricum sp. S1BR25-6]
MSEEGGHSEEGEQERTTLPIERGFPIERVNEIAEKESRAKQWYRPIYTMHKWWARRPGCLFRAITLYSLLDDETTLDDVEVYEPGENETLGLNGLSKEDLLEAIQETSMEDPRAALGVLFEGCPYQGQEDSGPVHGGWYNPCRSI